MAAGDASWKWGTSGSFTITLASLATSSTRLVGVESSALDLSTLGPIIDLQISGFITTGTSPTAARQIEIWAIGTTDNTNYPAPFDGTGSAETIGSAEQKFRYVVVHCMLFRRTVPATTPTRFLVFRCSNALGLFCHKKSCCS